MLRRRFIQEICSGGIKKRCGCNTCVICYVPANLLNWVILLLYCQRQLSLCRQKDRWNSPFHPAADAPEKIEIKDDAVGIVCPVYAVELPFMIVDFMKKADIKTDYFFFILTCGYGYEVSLGHAEVAARERGWDLKYGNGVLMVDNYLPFFDMDEEIRKLPGKNVEGQLDAICADIQARKERRVMLTSALQEQMAFYHKTHAPKVINKNMALDYTVNDDCIHCGICAKVCPANNTTFTEDGVCFSISNALKGVTSFIWESMD